MKRHDLVRLETDLMAETVKRRSLGGYSTEAAGILLLCETMMRVLQHLLEEMPVEKKK